jgi:hypothetical protein
MKNKIGARDKKFAREHIEELRAKGAALAGTPDAFDIIQSTGSNHTVNGSWNSFLAGC